MIQALINRYKRMRTEHFLRQTYQYSYAFVGMGQHSLANLYPVLHYLGVPLKYICVTSERKARLIGQKFPGVTATASLDAMLSDEAVRGVFVSASPSAHFSIASQVLKSGKSLFIEKPPCQTLEELDTLIALQQHGIPEHRSPARTCSPASARPRSLPPVAMVGLQKRYAPAIQFLRQRLGKEHLVSYDLHYLTGPYPEGDALLDLYVHPLDLVCFLFGKPVVLATQRVAKDSYLLMLRHQHVVGTLELSAAYTWTAAEESLKVCTRAGVYRLRQTEELTFEPGHPTLLGIPTEKIRTMRQTTEHLFQRSQFAPVLTGNQVYTQGFYGEIASFVSQVESGKREAAASLKSVRDTYELIFDILQK